MDGWNTIMMFQYTWYNPLIKLIRTSTQPPTANQAGQANNQNHHHQNRMPGMMKSEILNSLIPVVPQNIICGLPLIKIILDCKNIYIEIIKEEKHMHISNNNKAKSI